MSSKRVTIEDVARDAGVSITTVSRFLNERYDAMSEQTRLRIAGVIQTLNYQPNAMAQGLKGARSKMIAIIVVNIGYPFCVSLIRSLSNVFTPAGYNLVVCETSGVAEREYDMLQSLLAQQVDALVIQTNGDNNEELARIAAGRPVVLVDRHFTIPHALNVLTNNRESSFALTDALFHEGYQSVLYVTEEEQNIHTRIERLQGYQEACDVHARQPWVGWVTRGDPESFARIAESIRTMEKPPGPIAVYTANGLLLQELYPLLRDLGLDIPSTLGIATFDQPDWVNLVSPSLTCVHQPVEEMGEWTAKMLLHVLQSDVPIKKQRQVQILKSTLVLADSTKLSPL